MTQPPRVDVRSAGDKATRDAARARHESAKERRKAAGAALSACGDAIFAALNSPDFAYELEQRHGLVVGPALTSEPPAAPWEWAENVFDFLDPDTSPDPIERADELWAQAWRAGYEAASALHGTDPGDRS